MGRLFGTNGVRGIINEELTPELALDLGRAVGTVMGPGSVAIAKDSRHGGDMLARSTMAGILSTGCSVIDIGYAPTPALQFMVPRLDGCAGVVITASHNPPEFNGIKVLGTNGIEVSRALEGKIETVYFDKAFNTAAWDEVGQIHVEETALRQYIDAIEGHVEVETIRKKAYTVVIDGANSVGSLVTPVLLRELGCKVISINSQLDGGFPGRLPEPLPENLKDLATTVVSAGADLGVAHDGDADRATFVDETGRILWGDQSFAIIAERVLSRKKGSTLVTPVSSGRLIEDIANRSGAKIDWTVVGSVVVSHRIEEINAEFGGEENGGVFYPDHQAVRDGAMTAAQLVEIMALEEKRLSQLVEELPTYYSTKIKVHVPLEKKDILTEPLLKLTQGMDRVTIDGVKLSFDEGWILMRPSGTEPVWRCFAESDTQENSDELAKRGKALIEQAIQKT